MNTTTTRTRAPRGQWLIPTGLIFLALFPIVVGALRLTDLSGGPEIIPANPRFAGAPIPLILHIVSATVFSLVGAFQFLPALRRGKRRWHRMAGRILIPAGMIAALSGLWMATFYPHPAGDGELLFVIRLVFGWYMVVSITLAVGAIVRRNFVSHGAWMTRGYALGIAAGTQAFALIPGSIIFGSTHELSRAVAIGLAWVINLAVAEFIIHRRSIRRAQGQQSPHQSPRVVMPSHHAAP